MECPKCAGRLYVSNSEQMTEAERKREYVCPKCIKCFISYEKLEGIVDKDKGRVKNLINRIERSRQNAIRQV